MAFFAYSYGKSTNSSNIAFQFVALRRQEARKMLKEGKDIDKPNATTKQDMFNTVKYFLS